MRALVLVVCVATLAILIPVARAATDRSHGHSAAYWHWRWTAAHRQKLALRLEAWKAERSIVVIHRRDRASTYSGDLVEQVRSLAASFMCVHAGEGTWGEVDGGTYFGGLQMDRNFMDFYAPRFLLNRGTANEWSPLQQLAVGLLGWSDRGFQPWPTTGRNCGLLP